jgi:hypothetical protein
VRSCTRARLASWTWTVVAASLALAAPSRAQEHEELLDAPAPPTLPPLTHRTLLYGFEYTAASIEPNEDQGRAFAWFAEGTLELPLQPRKWYLGVASSVASGAIPGVGSATLLGNPEIWSRGVWSSVLGVSGGGGLGIVLPVPRDLTPVEAEVLSVVSTIRPWDVAYFSNLTLTFRPSFDIRHVTGRFMLQLRQGIDWSVSEEGTDFAARATFYAGVQVHSAVGLGLELWEVYQVTADLPDDKRAAFAISPSMRFNLPRVQPALSMLFPIATPLRGDVASYYAARIHVGFSFDYPEPPGDNEHD